MTIVFVNRENPEKHWVSLPTIQSRTNRIELQLFLSVIQHLLISPVATRFEAFLVSLSRLLFSQRKKLPSEMTQHRDVEINLNSPTFVPIT
jgi:hypothetical protein